MDTAARHKVSSLLILNVIKEFTTMHPAYIRVAYGMDRCQSTVRVAYGLMLHCTCRIWSSVDSERVAYGAVLHCTCRIWGGVALYVSHMG